MRIWLLSSEFPPAYGGGISTYCIETAQLFSFYGHEVTVITQDFQVNELTFIKAETYRVARFNPNKYYTASFLGYEANLSYAFAMVVKELASIEGLPDIVESQEYMGIAYFLLQYKWLRYPVFENLKIVVTLHAPSFLYLECNKVPVYQLPYFWIGEMERSCIRSADLLISPSRYLVEKLKGRIKTDDLNIHIIENPYQLLQYPDDLVIKRNKIVFFGKLIPQKGCLELITHFKKLWAAGFKHSLLMIGGGDHLYHPEGIDMINYIQNNYKKEINSGQLQLLGSLKPKEIDRHLNDAHVVIVPSLIDNLPYTVLEAMGKGKIVLASESGGQSEVIEDGVDGFLFDPNNYFSFELRLNQLLSLSDEAIKEMGKKALLKIKKKYSYEQVYTSKIRLLNTFPVKGNLKKRFPLTRPISPDGLLSGEGTRGLLSVVIPYYNMGNYIGDAIKSVVNSSYKEIEIILVNDGSNDPKSLEILEAFARNHKVKVLHKENEGLALARNAGAIKAHGEYLAFLDPDDTVESEYYSKAINVLQQYENIYFVGCWARYFGETKGYWPAFNPEPPFLLVHNMINSSALVYKKQAFIKTGLNDPLMVFGMEDYESVINMVKNGYSGVALPEPLWNYRVRKDSMARAFTRKKQLYLYKLMAEKHGKFFANFTTEVVNLLNANGPGFTYDNPTFYIDFPVGGFFNNKAKNVIINLIKSNKMLRKAAVRIKKYYKGI